jgi:hypothetical protein
VKGAERSRKETEITNFLKRINPLPPLFEPTTSQNLIHVVSQAISIRCPFPGILRASFGVCFVAGVIEDLAIDFRLAKRRSRFRICTSRVETMLYRTRVGKV